MAENGKKSTISRKRLDFGVVRKKLIRKPEKVAEKPVAVEKPAETQPDAPRKPLTVNRGKFIDFAPARPRKPLVGSERIVSDITSDNSSDNSSDTSSGTAPVSVKTSSVKVSHNSVETSSTSVEVSRDGAPRRVVSRGLRMDFVRRPSPVGTSTPTRPTSIPSNATVADVLGDTPDEPLMSDDDLAAALAGFADAGISEDTPDEPRRSSDDESEHTFADAESVSDLSDFEAELDAFDELSDDIFDGQSVGDDIDRIEAEIEAEANDFVKEPKPLFEDPLVKISKVREEKEQQREAAESERMKEEAREKAKEAAKRAPYAALYTSTSGRSPFLTSVTVEKRPLSSSTPTVETRQKPNRFSKGQERQLKNSYTSRMKKQLEDDAKAIHRETMIIAAPEVKSHNTALIIGIILTVLLGAGVGAIVYLVFFQ